MDEEYLRAIEVYDMDSSVTEQHLRTHFSKKKHGGGDIENVYLFDAEDSTTRRAIIIFKNAEIQQTLDKDYFAQKHRLLIKRYCLQVPVFSEVSAILSPAYCNENVIQKLKDEGLLVSGFDSTLNVCTLNGTLDTLEKAHCVVHNVHLSNRARKHEETKPVLDNTGAIAASSTYFSCTLNPEPVVSMSCSTKDNDDVKLLEHEHITEDTVTRTVSKQTDNVTKTAAGELHVPTDQGDATKVYEVNISATNFQRDAIIWIESLIEEFNLRVRASLTEDGDYIKFEGEREVVIKCSNWLSKIANCRSDTVPALPEPEEASQEDSVQNNEPTGITLTNEKSVLTMPLGNKHQSYHGQLKVRDVGVCSQTTQDELSKEGIYPLLPREYTCQQVILPLDAYRRGENAIRNKMTCLESDYSTADLSIEAVDSKLFFFRARDVDKAAQATDRMKAFINNYHVVCKPFMTNTQENTRALEIATQEFADLEIAKQGNILTIAGDYAKIQRCLQLMSAISPNLWNDGTSVTDHEQSTESLLQSNDMDIQEKHESIDNDILCFLTKFKTSKWRKLNTNRNFEVITHSKGRSSVIFNGKRSTVEKNMKYFKEMISGVEKKTLNISESPLNDSEVAVVLNDTDYTDVLIRLDTNDRGSKVIIVGEDCSFAIRMKLKEKLKIGKKRNSIQDRDVLKTKAKSREKYCGVDYSYQFSTREGIKVYVLQQDITKIEAAAIVNAANGYLQHGGGIALAIANAAGDQYMSECNSYIYAHGKMSISDCYTTAPGNLRNNCQYIINAVGPDARNEFSRKPTEYYHDLLKTFENVLKEAHKLRIKSVAIPLISSGIYGVPKTISADKIVQAISEFSRTSGSDTSIQHILLVNIDEESTSVIISTFEAQIRKGPPTGYTHSNIPDVANVGAHALPQTSHGDSADFCEICSMKHGTYTVLKCNHKCCESCLLSKKLSAESYCSSCECCVCMDNFADTELPCGHKNCVACIEEMRKSNPRCPCCQKPFDTNVPGPQPSIGSMTCDLITTWLPGYPHCGTIVIYYHFPDGIQEQRHPHPGKRYTGTARKAYLPDNKEGKEVYSLLYKAFQAGHVFRIGDSVTTDKKDTVIWNDIHHKTNIWGGPSYFGYPDPTYLKRVKEELRSKGFVSTPYESSV